MSEIQPTAALTQVKAIDIDLPGGKWPMPAWMAKAFIESVFAHDRATYARHMIGVHAGQIGAKPGRKAADNGG